MSILKNHFDRSKPFYPLVMHYVIQLIGFKDLAVRGILCVSNFKRDILGATGGGVDIDAATSNEELKEWFRQLVGPLNLRTEQDDDYVNVDIDEIATDLATNVTYLADFIMQSASHVLILAHEISKDRPYHDQEPLWEFLRHCRNAMAHGGRFNLRHGEPRHAAVWGKFKIEPSLHDTPLFKDRSLNGLIAPGDVVRLLWDIEQAYPDM